MGNNPSRPRLHALDPLQSHIVHLIYPSLSSTGTRNDVIIIKALDIAFLVRSLPGFVSDLGPQRVKLINYIKPKAERSTSCMAALCDAVCGPPRTLALVVSSEDGRKTVAKVDHSKWAHRGDTMAGLCGKVEEEIKVILEKKAELQKKAVREKVALETEAMLKAHTIPSVMPGNMPGIFPGALAASYTYTEEENLNKDDESEGDESFTEEGDKKFAESSSSKPHTEPDHSVKGNESEQVFMERIRGWAAKKNDVQEEDIREVEVEETDAQAKENGTAARKNTSYENDMDETITNDMDESIIFI
jgi:hypothetical protein